MYLPKLIGMTLKIFASFFLFFLFFFVTSHKFKSVFMGVFLKSIKWAIMTCFWKRCNLLLPRHFNPLTPKTLLLILPLAGTHFLVNNLGEFGVRST